MENNKNIWLLTTDKPSRLYRVLEGYLRFEKEETNYKYTQNQNIYITSDEEIKKGDWCLSRLNELVKFKDKNFNYKKIILTTDPSLDGIQAIPDEFLEWFVKNPSCERVEVKKGFADGSAYGYDFLSYKIIIPKVSKPTSMENKTPMQELIEYIEEFTPKNKVTDGIWSKAKSLLEKEEKLILNTFIDGEVNCGRQLAKDYYNEKINNNGK
jgi:hypothetical protein